MRVLFWGTLFYMLRYASTIFVSAFLLFLVQPIMAKMILPWFGGSAAVWATCLVFFQVVLLLGYLYAHGITRRLSAQAQATLHITLLVLSLLVLPLAPSAAWKPAGGEDPTWRILGLLTVSLGLPYLLLSTTGPLMQAWYARTEPGAFPYRLFALSNFASLLALIGYPTLLEPNIATRMQGLSWSAGYVLFVLLCATTAWYSRRSGAASVTGEEAIAASPSWRDQLLWLLLAACGSVLLLSISNYLAQNIAAIPFLWLLPLTLYLLTFILCFEGRGWYHRGLFLRLTAVALGSMAYFLSQVGAEALLKAGIPLFGSGLFLCCMFCHGELSRRKPALQHLTLFYLMISLGGALGAIFVGIIAPRVFRSTYELSFALLFTALLALYVAAQEAVWMRLLWAGVSAGMVVLLVREVQTFEKDSLAMVRNFYGSLRVVQSKEGQHGPLRTLYNGTINHGSQFLTMPWRKQPTTYYGHKSGAGLALDYCCSGPRRVGVVGLGAGTLAVYGRPGDTFRIYEINPLDLHLARTVFTYLKESSANVEIAMGDARLSMEREPDQRFDVILVDAFSGDAIPVHLLTKESCALYFRHLKPDGILAFHVSNKYLSLAPVAEQLARLYGKQSLLIDDDDDDDADISSSDWVLISGRQSFFALPEIAAAGEVIPPRPNLRLWTDDYNNLFQVLKW